MSRNNNLRIRISLLQIYSAKKPGFFYQKMTKSIAERGSALTQEILQSLNPTDLLLLVKDRDDPNILRRIAQARFAIEARMENDDFQAPFIRWPAMNSELKPWLPLLLAKVAKRDFALSDNNDRLVVIGIPSSATPYIEGVQKHHLFSSAVFPHLLKPQQFEKFGVSVNGTLSLAVPSYVHGRDPKTGARGTQDIFFFQSEVYEGATVVCFDDALAEGLSAEFIGKFVKQTLHARRFLVAVSMAKTVQGGEEKLKQSDVVDNLSVLIHVTKTHGKGKPIEFY